ncbi:hypothetical protein [Actinomadura sp. 3N407]|uniref:hypothetical protein n=1 Tax=Actinomadura sp. 3N407 TaxID=3457423 RepID=UPI003FCD9FE3
MVMLVSGHVAEPETLDGVVGDHAFLDGLGKDHRQQGDDPADGARRTPARLVRAVLGSMNRPRRAGRAPTATIAVELLDLLHIVDR